MRVSVGNQDSYSSTLEEAVVSTALGLTRTKKNLGYMGDDFPDLTTLPVAGFFASVPNAPEKVRNHASFVSLVSGGPGAVRELCEFVLEAQGFDPLELYNEKLL